MKPLYEAKAVTARVHKMFEELLPGFTKPTRWALAFLVVAMLAVGITRSVRDLYRKYLAKVTAKSLTAFYYDLGYAKEKEQHSSMCALGAKAMSLVPAELREYPVFVLTDDTLIEKFGKKFAHVELLFDHAAHDGRQYKNGHCFVSLMLCVPVGRDEKGNVVYLPVPLEHRIWKKDGDSKLQIAHDMVKDLLPSLEMARDILILCDSWYTKGPFICILEEDPRINIIAAARADTFMTQPDPPQPTGRRGRPRKWGDRVRPDDFELKSGIMDDYLVGTCEVRTKLFGDRVVSAFVTRPVGDSGSRRLYFSTLSEQDLAAKMHLKEDEASGAGIQVYHERWHLEVFYEVGKLFWQIGGYMLRTGCGIERLVNLISLAYAGMLILPYTEDEFAYMRDVSPQDIRFEIGTILRDELFSARLVQELEKRNKSVEFVNDVKDAVYALRHAA